ncbi:hypothetical protein Vretimale_12950 [Volvox reticuliferus]|uniref:Uncharacterized protein n=1 Tax=Volvox reticuliferus TaxID=1737510 RepID=A0A8J4CFS1_9CHLO|nr:hypothetical protein Vretifemale_9319 [Volvox reticuliferus]GIM09081.1 hypothetical protein Vretimale_12950 [Volvox reticuliferus]
MRRRRSRASWQRLGGRSGRRHHGHHHQLQSRARHAASSSTWIVFPFLVAFLLKTVPSSTATEYYYDVVMANTTSDPNVVTLQGQLQYRTTRPTGAWMLSFNISMIYKLPRQPVDADSGSAIPPGSGVMLSCVLSSSTTCTDIFDEHITSAAPVTTTNVTLPLLVMVISVNASNSCEGKPGASVSDVENAFLRTGGYADFMDKCSYGKMIIDRDALTVIPIFISCARVIMNCDEDAIAAAARRRLPKALLSQAASSRLAYVLPAALAPICGWVGISELPGVQSWFSADSLGIFSKGTVMQQILENFGIYPSYKDGVPFDDWSTAMGSGDSCPSAPELWRLGWATPLALLSATRFASRVYRLFTLPATYLGPTGVLIRIQPDWLGTTYTKNLYLGLRIKAGGDTDLLEEFNRKVSIHEVAKDIDNDFSAWGDAHVSLLGVVAPGSSITLFNYRLHILTGALINDGTAVAIRICRFFVGPTECVEGPSPSPPSPPPPPSPNPPPSPRPPPPSPPPRPPPPSPKPPPPGPRPPKPSPRTLSPPSPMPKAPPLRPNPTSLNTPSPPSSKSPPSPKLIKSPPPVRQYP